LLKGKIKKNKKVKTKKKQKTWNIIIHLRSMFYESNYNDLATSFNSLLILSRLDKKSGLGDCKV
jgi:hypothetical protein